MEYVPGRRPANAYVPVAVDSVSAAVFVPTFVSVIFAPGIAAPDESVTVPVMLPVSSCPNIVAVVRIRKTVAKSRRTVAVMRNSGFTGYLRSNQGGFFAGTTLRQPAL